MFLEFFYKNQNSLNLMCVYIFWIVANQLLKE